ncbi:MAG: tyrosine-protein phosphatase [Acidimicrobiia bacterium]|nr:tyrosine-protein phosphatase [Acidimicrobiia bacterium]MYG58982.1 tyrosine-protein phosphatase [Acidimicrobiia bacterium]MYJ33115.1 tyrosine-protein phosphatase [Acidimicrobiia bacterium]
MQGNRGLLASVPGVESIRNFRPLGGQTTVDGREVQTGLVFRSAHLAEASDADLNALIDLGIRTVFDFRNQVDIAFEGPNRLPDGVEQVSLPMVDSVNPSGLREDFSLLSAEELEERFGNGRAFQRMKEVSGRTVSNPERSSQFGEFVRKLLAPGAAPVLFNCSAGKDRTGWAASLLLLAVGVPEQQVVDHYLETNQHVDTSRYDDLLVPIATVHEDFFAEQMQVLADTWGTFDQYWTDAMGLDEGHRQALRDLLLG